MAPGARVAAYKAVYSFGGYMSDVMAAIDQAVEDGVDILSLSIGPTSVPQGPASFLDIMDIELLFATKAGILVVQAVGNGGPSASTTTSFSPWIASVAASTTDRTYNTTLELGNGQIFSGVGLSPPTQEGHLLLAAAADVSFKNSSSLTIDGCQRPELFIPSMVQGKLIICTYISNFEFDPAPLTDIVGTIYRVGASGFILTFRGDLSSRQITGNIFAFPIPGFLVTNPHESSALWEYYNINTIRDLSDCSIKFGATARISDGRHAIYTRQPPVVASYSSRGPDVNNALMQTADILKPNILAPGSLIWAAWSPTSEGSSYLKGQRFAMVSGTSMATPHVAGVAALIKQKHPNWSPAAIISSIMSTADTEAQCGRSILAQSAKLIAPANPFDYGAGLINPTRALDPGLVFDADFNDFIQFLCSVPGVDDKSVRRATGFNCPTHKPLWSSDLNSASITVSSLVCSRKVVRVVTNVADEDECYHISVREPLGVTVKVKPQSFRIKPNSTKSIRVFLTGIQALDEYSFGEMRFEGDKGHIVRVPLVIYVATAIRM